MFSAGQTCTLPGRLLCLLFFCKVYFFCIFFYSHVKRIACTGMFNKTSIVYLLQLLQLLEIHFGFFFSQTFKGFPLSRKQVLWKQERSHSLQIWSNLVFHLLLASSKSAERCIIYQFEREDTWEFPLHCFSVQ